MYVPYVQNIEDNTTIFLCDNTTVNAIIYKNYAEPSESSYTTRRFRAAIFAYIYIVSTTNGQSANTAAKP